MNISISVKKPDSKIINFLISSSKIEPNSFLIEAFDNTGKLVTKWYRESIVAAMEIVGLIIQQQN